MPNFDHAQNLFNHIASNANIFAVATTYEKSLESFQYNAKEASAFYDVNPDRQPAGGGVKGFVKRCIRKGIGWHMRPAFAEQRLFNTSVTRSLNDLEPMLAHFSAEIAKVTAMVEKLQANQEEISKRLAELNGKTLSPHNRPEDESNKESDQ